MKNKIITDKELSKGILLFGAGQYGEYVCKYLIKNGYNVKYFIDSNEEKQGTKINNIPVISPKDKSINNYGVMFITAKHCAYEILSQYKYNINIAIFDNWFINENKNEFDRISNIFHDKKSSDVLNKILQAKISDTPSQLFDIVEPNQYFCLGEFFSVTQFFQEYFVDAGAYVGDTIENFLINNCGQFQKIYAFEPTEKSYKAMEIRCKRLSLEWAKDYEDFNLFNAGVDEKSGKLNICSSEVASSNKLENSTRGGGGGIPVYALDDIIETPVTFMKADIEGMELNFLKGAKKIIQTYKPKMAIAAYHKPEDIFELTDYILSLVPEYKVSIRHHSYSFDETVLYFWI